MRLLLDTHTLVWALAEPSRLSVRARAGLANPAADVYVSMASAWELSILHGLDRVRLAAPLDAIFTEGLSALRVGLLPIQLQHVAAVGALPRHHRDPFDRLIIATAITERLTLVSCDAVFDRYDVPVLW